MLKLNTSPSPIIPSILVTNRAEFDARLEFAHQGARSAHIDVIDGEFCSGETLAIEEWPELDLDYAEAHLMVVTPLPYLEKVASKNVTRAIVHAESTFDLEQLTKTARELDLLLGFAVNPDTDLAKLRNLLDTNAYIQVMGVHPGASNQSLIDQTPTAINYLKKSTAKRLIISVDGGVSSGNAQNLTLAGANYLVASHALFHDSNWAENYQQLLGSIKNDD